MKIIQRGGAPCELRSLNPIPTGIRIYPAGIILYDEKIDLIHFKVSYPNRTFSNFSIHTIFKYKLFPNELHKPS